jgi:hypothetical protein
MPFIEEISRPITEWMEEVVQGWIGVGSRFRSITEGCRLHWRIWA